MTSGLTDALVAARLEELRELDALGRSLLSADVPPMTPALLAARSLVVSARPDAPPSVLGDARDVVLFAEPGRVTREVGWMGDTAVDPASGRATLLGPFVLVRAVLLSGEAVDRVPPGRAAWVTVRFLADPLVPPPSSVYLSTAWDAAHTAWPR